MSITGEKLGTDIVAAMLRCSSAASASPMARSKGCASGANSSNGNMISASNIKCENARSSHSGLAASRKSPPGSVKDLSWSA